MKICRFEDILAWQEARLLTNIVFKFLRENREMQKSYRFRDQIISSAISVMANIAEGFSRKSNKEFIRFLFISKGSLSELQSHLYVALDQEILKEKRFNEIYQQTDKVARFISSFISYLLRHG